MNLTRHLKGDGLRSRALRSTLIVLGASVVGQVMRLTSNLILTRLLFPEAFGLMALIQTFMVGLQLFSDIGLAQALIQSRRGEEPDFLNTAWTLQVIRGGCLWLAAAALAWPLSVLYDEPQILWILPVVGLNALIAGFASTKMVLADRRLVLGRRVAIDLSCQILGLAIMVALAFALKSVWALVIGGVITNILGLLAGHLLMPGMPNRLRWERRAVGEVIGFGKFIFISTLAGFFVNQGDKILLGRVVSLADLGIYNIAFFLATFPLSLGGMLAQRILFPLYREIRPSDGPASRRKIGRVRNLLTGTMVAMLCAVALIGDPLVHLLYDPRYAPAGPMVIILALAQIPQSLMAGNSQLLLAEGNSRDFSRIVLVETAVSVLGYLGGFWFFGLFGILLVSGLRMMAVYPLQQYYLHRHQGTDLPRDAIFAGVALVAAIATLWVNWDTVSDFYLTSRTAAPAVTGSWQAETVFAH